MEPVSWMWSMRTSPRGLVACFCSTAVRAKLGEDMATPDDSPECRRSPVIPVTKTGRFCGPLAVAECRGSDDGSGQPITGMEIVPRLRSSNIEQHRMAGCTRDVLNLEGCLRPEIQVLPC